MISRPYPALIPVTVHAEFNGFFCDIGHKKAGFRVYGFGQVNGKKGIAVFLAVFKDEFYILCLGSNASDVYNPVFI